MAIKELINRLSFVHFSTKIWLLVFIDLIGSMAVSTFTPFLTLYLYQDYGLTMTLTGILLAVIGFSCLPSQLLGGILSDRYGRRSALLAFFGFSVCAFIALTILIGLSTSLWLIIMIYIIAMFTSSMTIPVVAALMTDLSPPEQLTEVYGIKQIAQNLGWMLGTILGGYLLSRFSFAYLFIAIIAANSISWLLIASSLKGASYKTRESSQASFQDAFSFVKDNVMLMFTFLTFVLFLVVAQMTTTLSVFVVDRLNFTTTQFGFLLSLNGLIVILAQYFVTHLVNRVFGEAKAVILGSLFFGIGFLTLGWVNSYGLLIVSIAIITCGEMLYVPTSFSLVSKLPNQDKRGQYIGLLSTGQRLGGVLGPLIGGRIFDVFNNKPPILWGIIASVAFIASFGLFQWRLLFNKRASNRYDNSI